MSACSPQFLNDSSTADHQTRLADVPAHQRPTLAVAGGELVSAVQTAPTLISGVERWRGFAMEVLDTPPSETPPRTTIVRHLVCSIDSVTPFRIHWRDNGRERTRLVMAGDHLIRSQQELVGFRWDTATRALILGIEPDTMEALVQDLSLSKEVQLQEFYGVPDDYLHSLMRALAADLAHDSPTGPMLGESLCTAIAVHATRRYATDPPKQGTLKRSFGDYRLRLVLDYIESRLSHELSLFELAQVAGISPYHLSRMFKSQMHCSVHQYVLRQRIERAKMLLRRTSLDLSVIGSGVGFRHQSHFSQVFRSRVGVPPQQFRQAL